MGRIWRQGIGQKYPVCMTVSGTHGARGEGREMYSGTHRARGEGREMYSGTHGARGEGSGTRGNISMCILPIRAVSHYWESLDCLCAQQPNVLSGYKSASHTCHAHVSITLLWE